MQKKELVKLECKWIYLHKNIGKKFHVTFDQSTAWGSLKRNFELYVGFLSVERMKILILKVSCVN